MRAGVAWAADAVGVALLIGLGWRMFFAFDIPLQTPALIVGAVGCLACWAQRGAVRSVHWSMLAYAAVVLAITAAHNWPATEPVFADRLTRLFEPSVHAAVMVVFIYGAAHLVRTHRRLSLLVIFITLSALVLGVQIVFDRASTAFIYERGGIDSTPSVPNWSGIHGASLFLTLALPFVIAPGMVQRRAAAIASALLLTAAFLGINYVNGSRGGLIAMATAAGAMFLVAVMPATRWRRIALLGTTFVIAVVAMWVFISTRKAALGEEFLSFRDIAWGGAFTVFTEHPWFGVGPGNYAAIALSRARPGYQAFVNAHNLFLQAAAETGAAGVLCLVTYLFAMLRSCWRAWLGGRSPLIALGLFGSLAGFIAHSVSENFLSERVEVERTRLLVWTVFAATLALERLTRVPADQES